ncbi:Sua5/YciO/YrdC/YwlC family protein [Mycoplasmopsis gallinarum]|uniref:L-threonylcarbamoyladenylate synthase n=1 Tax=Mycoplasmopsis gallinarum TaxID=29557 RepID=A0A168RD99_9BACT|nr:Sua5/YciO/YrdC/YwlC family protein [Mycoplasmopsis gallinarum]OAB48862.1 YrdC/Sua5 family protein [Mycoplasmopsis gallinarum]
MNDIFICSTDTVTGIGGPINQNTLDKIYELKQRPKNKKIMIVVGSIEQARNFKEWNYEADRFAQKYWPGAYSIVINNQGFRMPNNKMLCDFLLKNGPMYLTSANISGQNPIKLSEASKVFPEVKNIYDFGESTQSNEASKIYNLDIKEWIR